MHWLGIEIKPGMAVWRGARDGNSSEYRVGRVLKVNKDKATVEWVGVNHILYFHNSGTSEHIETVKRMGYSWGPEKPTLCDIQGLVPISEELYKQAKARRLATNVVVEARGNPLIAAPQNVSEYESLVSAQLDALNRAEGDNDE